jgi:hypothetical protein
MAKAPPSPPGPARPASKQVMIVPMPEAPGRYLLQQKRANTLFTDQGLTLRLTPPAGPARELQWGVAGARTVLPQPLEPQEARFNLLVGRPEDWKQNLPTWGALYYPGINPGVDLWFEAREGGVQYSLRAGRGADLRQVRLEWRGAQELRLADNGRALEVRLADGALREEGLQCGQESADGTSREVPCRYKEVSPRGVNVWEYVIEVDVDEPGRPAWVDPIINWNSFVGAAGNDALEDIEFLNNTQNQFFFAGSTDISVADPLQGTRLFTPSAGTDVVISRRQADGTPIWVSLLGGNGEDLGRAILLGAGGFLYVAGSTTSTNFPPGPGGTSLSGPRDGFIARIASFGSSLSWIQFIGGPGDEEIHSLALGEDGKVYAAGWTTSQQMPASDAGPSLGMKDLFVSRIHPNTGIVERTLVRSGRFNEEATSIVPGESGDGRTLLYVTGYTESPDFPLGVSPPSENTQIDGGREALVLKLNDQLGTPVWGTFIGAASGPDEGNEVLYVPGANRVMVVGTTRAADFPNSYPASAPPGANAFLAAFDPGTGTRTFSTVVGGSGDDEGNALTTGTAQSLFIGGKTTSTDLPVPFGFDSRSGETEGFVIQMGPDGTGFRPEWGTYAGGTQADDVRALASSLNHDTLYIGGMTRSPEMLPHQLRPTDEAHSGGEDMFLIALASTDLTPPLGEVRDGLSGDMSTDMNAQAFSANWSFTDRETPIQDYRFGAGTHPGCDNVIPFRSVGLNVSVALSSAQQQMPELERGRWYFATVIARNQAGMENTVSSNGYFLLLPDGGPNPLPPRPGPVTPCPGEPPDGGTPDAGVDAGVDAGADAGVDAGTGTDGGAGQGDGGSGPRSPAGWSCGCGTTSGPTGLMLLVLVALGLRTARRGSP